MGIKRSTTYRKIEFEYATDDGDNFLIVYSETDNKQNVSIVKKYKSKDGKYVNKDGKDVNERDKPHSYDVVMWLDIADELRSLVAPQPANLINPSNTISDEPSLVPLISDMRGQQIDQAVAESMTKSTTEATPRESLTVDMAQRSGVVLETPDEWKVDNLDEDWKKDAMRRGTGGAAITGTPRGSEGEGFRRKE